ncbi:MULTISPECIES: hypothetical protein [unclassified Gemella]|uniref:hypothetical protein n=1 Tax=unclassified Gemella TaxID=2624949 RepID=UPI00207B225F|nr:MULTISPECIES: hypothetical protein [unclassified Gemella]
MKNKKLLSILTIGCLSLSLVGCGDKVGSVKDGNEQKIEQASIKLVNAVEQGKYKLVSTEELKNGLMLSKI